MARREAAIAGRGLPPSGPTWACSRARRWRSACARACVSLPRARCKQFVHTVSAHQFSAAVGRVLSRVALARPPAGHPARDPRPDDVHDPLRHTLGALFFTSGLAGLS